MKNSEILKQVLEIANKEYKQYSNCSSLYICAILDDITCEGKEIKERLKRYIGTSAFFPYNVNVYDNHIRATISHKKVPRHFVNFLRIKLIEELITRFEEEGD